MENLIWLNDELVKESEAKISVYDHGFLYGDGLFETLHVYEGKVFALADHLDRLFSSLAVLQIAVPWSKDDLALIINKTVAANQITGLGSVRLTISRGSGPLGLSPSLCPKPTLVVMAKEAKPYAASLRSLGVDVVLVSTRRNHPEALPPSLKSLNFLNNILAKMEVVQKGAFEGLMCNSDGYLTEGTVSNFFIVREDGLATPPLSAGILPGVTRKIVLECAKRLNIRVAETNLTWFDLYHAREAFLTNSSLEVMPIRCVDEQLIGDGKPGKITKQLAEEFKHFIG